MKYFYLNCFLFFHLISSAQSLDESYLNLRSRVSSSPEEVVKEAKSLKKDAIVAENFKIASKADYLSAFAFYVMGSSDSTVVYASWAIETAKKKKYKEGEALGLRILGTQYAKLGLLDKSQNSLNQALKLLYKLEGDEANEIRGMIYSSFLVLMNDNEDLNKKIVTAKKAINSYEMIQDQMIRKERLISAYTNIGYLYSKTEKFDSAQIFFQKALENIEQDNFYMHAAVYHDIGLNLFRQGDFNGSVKNYLKALDNCQENSFLNKKLEILSRLSDSYDSLGETKKSLYYLQEYNRINDSLSVVDKIALNEINNPGENSKPIDNHGYIKWIILLVLLIIITIFFIKKKSKTKQEVSVSQAVVISDEMKSRIEKDLKEVEGEKLFLDQNISLYSLANKFQYNTKYLSMVIKNCKGKTFSQYINDLRIQYVLDKLQNEKDFRNFKISYLAETSGFSSHGSFAAAFRSYTNENPSDYIKRLKELN